MDALLTSFAPGFPGSVDGDLHALGVDGDLRGTRADGDRQVEALAWNKEMQELHCEIFDYIDDMN